MPHLSHLTLIVRDYDEALAFYVGKLRFTLVEDTLVPEQAKRWVTIRPPGAPGQATTLLLARAAGPEQTAAIGRQGAGRVFLFLATDDFARDHAAFTAAGVRFVRPPAVQPYGIVAVFEDLYGNRWDLIQYRATTASRSRAMPDTIHPLATPQTARASIRAGDRVVLESEVSVTPLGLLAIGGLVAAILLSVPPIVRASSRAATKLPPPPA
ncbi:VOC family protein [Sphingomonas sp. M1-B02]|uniref:VOC family protein n=1 Tax=Sphingomonas sp. M1-B02 TaxID=3114300 RepID=UPI0022407AA1|nr:VOC family protein [Sphingomonas sp. S6-11]UZK65507.1 VOC family protein [Sphingomonas sp. S6-11]